MFIFSDRFLWSRHFLCQTITTWNTFLKQIQRWFPFILLFHCTENVDNEIFPRSLSCDIERRCRPKQLTENSTWWRHEMEAFPALLALCVGYSPVTGEFPAKGQWSGALMFSLIPIWINGCVNNHDTGDLRRHRAHYDVTVISWRSRTTD